LGAYIQRYLKKEYENATKRFHAATLTELLAAVGIVAVLAAVLFPVFIRARNKNDDAACVSNLRQIGLGIAQYTNDYDEREPRVKQWGAEIYPYIRNASVYQCPKDSNKATVSTYPLSYAMNSNLNSINIATISSPSVTVLGTEYDSKNVNMTSSTDKSIYSKTNGLESKKIIAWGSLRRLGLYKAVTAPRHDPNLIFLATDGHVKMLLPQQVVGGSNAPKSTSPPNMIRAAGSYRLGTKWTLTFSAI
jgi:type II secretory pathway pseudopilin PulG